MKLEVKARYRNRNTAYDAGQVIEVTEDEAAALMADSPDTFVPAQAAKSEVADERFHIEALSEAQHEALYDAGFLTVADLTDATDDDLQAVESIGAKSVAVIREETDE